MKLGTWLNQHKTTILTQGPQEIAPRVAATLSIVYYRLLQVQPQLPCPSEWGWEKTSESSNQCGQHYLKLQRSTVNLYRVDAVGAGVRCGHLHAHHYVLVMSNVAETKKR